MSTPQLKRLREHCHRLRLYQVEQELYTRLDEARIVGLVNFNLEGIDGSAREGSPNKTDD
jgi:hypothetical protein